MKKNRYILDIGTGRGNKIPQLKKRGLVYGIDISEETISKVRHRFPNIKFYVMSCEQLSFESSFFSEIYCYDVLEHVMDLPKSLSEIYRVLKPGGKLFVEVPYWRSEQKLLKIRPSYFSEIGHQRIFTPELQTIFLKSGFFITKTSKKHGIVHIELSWQFRHGVTINNQQGGYTKNPPILLKILFMLFNENLFLTPIKYLFPIWLITFPIGKLLSYIFPKTLHFELSKP